MINTTSASSAKVNTNLWQNNSAPAALILALLQQQQQQQQPQPPTQMFNSENVTQNSNDNLNVFPHHNGTPTMKEGDDNTDEGEEVLTKKRKTTPVEEEHVDIIAQSASTSPCSTPAVVSVSPQPLEVETFQPESVEGSPLFAQLASSQSLFVPNASTIEKHHHAAETKITADCVVCGDKSSGKHYGQFTCEGCKSFFKRSVRRSLVYTCRGQQNCIIDQHHRNQCQYCRFAKCLGCGMKKEAVQRGRSNSMNFMSSANLNGYFNAVSVPPPSNFFHAAPAPNSQAQQHSGFKTVVEESTPMAALPPPTHPAGNNILTLILGGVEKHIQSSQYVTMLPESSGIQEIASRLLFIVVDWAKLAVGNEIFAPVLTDFGRLLKSAWAHLWLLTAAQMPWTSTAFQQLQIANSVDSNSRADSPVNLIDGDESMSPLSSQVALINQQIEKIRSLNLDATEFSLLKSLILFSDNVPGLINSTIVEVLQEKLASSLDDYVRSKFNNSTLNTGQVVSSSSLLLRLGALRLSVTPDCVEKVFFSRLVGNVSIESLLDDMLANRIFSSTPAS